MGDKYISSISVKTEMSLIVFQTDQCYWIELNWIELNWIELNWIEFNSISLFQTVVQMSTKTLKKWIGFSYQLNPIQVTVSFIIIITHLYGTAKDLEVGG